MDIVERLRICAKYDPDQAEAADEIEFLSAKLKPYEEAERKLRELRESLKSQVVKPCDCSQHCMGDEYLCASWYARKMVKGGE